MGYLDIELGIKSVSGIKKHIITHFKNKNVDVQLDCVKVAKGVRCFWAINNHLHQHDMKGSVIYVIREQDLIQLIMTIEESLKQRR